MFKIIMLFTIIILSQNLLFSGTIDPKHSDDKYIELAQEERFSCVAPLVSTNKEKITSTSSCVIIKDRFALTAAHIFSTVPKDHVFYILLNNKKYLVKEVICHKMFEPHKMGFYDIALCKTEDALEIEKFPELYRNRTELLKKVYICGYGLTGTFDSGSSIADGKKRAGTNLIEAIKNHSLVCSPSHSPNSDLEFLISHGDSGGGLFIGDKLAGINSYVYTSDGSANSSWKDKAGHTRVSLFLDWIKENTK